MKIDVSIGEAIDKLSILELKSKKIQDPVKLQEIHKEIGVLDECNQYKNQYAFFYDLLNYVNEKIWNMTDTIKMLKPEEDPLLFSKISHEIFEFNQKRFRIKSWFNTLINTDIKEQKSYQSTFCRIIINNEEEIYDKIAEINYLLLEYDCVIFNIEYTDIIQRIFKNPNGLFVNPENIEPSNVVVINNYSIPNDVEREIFEFIPIRYISGGFLGDFIQQLSVINEKFYETGRKGILYISDKDYGFRKSLEDTYQDTYPVVSTQRYILKYDLYKDEIFDINLSIWRNSPNLFKINWYYLFKEVYHIEWGKHKWLQLPYNDQWKDTVLINVMHYRFATNIHFEELYRLYQDSLLFISFGEEEYHHFIQTTNVQIKHFIPSSFMEMCIAIHSCKLLVGSLSAFLTIGHATHINRIVGLCNIVDDNHNIGLDLPGLYK